MPVIKGPTYIVLFHNQTSSKYQVKSPTWWILCMWFLSCARSGRDTPQISQATWLPLLPLWPGLTVGLGEPRLGRGVVETEGGLWWRVEGGDN